MKLLATGTQGYIGSIMMMALKSQGHEVAGIDTGFYAEDCLYDAESVRTGFLRKDIRKISEADVTGYDALLHLGELSNDPLGQINPDLTFEINHQGSVRLARLCKRVGVPRFIYSSSCSVYGLGAGEFKDEQSPVNPQTAYAECKVRVEREVSAMADDRFSPTFLRNATVYGLSPRFRFDLVLNNLAGTAQTMGEIKMSSDGSPWRPLVHVRDVCQAFLCALHAPREVVHNQVFNVGATAENFRVREIAEIVAGAFPGCGIRVGGGDRDSRSYRVSFDKIAARLPGFRCAMSARDGARELRELFERIGLDRARFEDRAFTRLKQIRHLLETQQLDEHLFWRHEPPG